MPAVERACGPLLMMLSCAVAARAQNPAARAHHALAYDEHRQRIVLHGGSTAQGNSHGFFDDYQEWDGTRWSPARATGVHLSGQALFYDAARNRLILAAGMNDGGMRGATYRWDGSAWAELLPADSTLAVADVAAAYDRHRGRAVLYGGIMAGNRLSAYTWEFDGTRWTRLDAPGPGPLTSAGMAYDEGRRRVVLHGGIPAFGPEMRPSDRTWEWDGRAWTEVKSQGGAAGPGGLASMAMAYDPVRRHVVLFGGINKDGMAGETWSWDGTTWRRLATTGPAPRALAQMAFDRKRGVMVLFGGRIRYPLDSDETWEWNGTAWRRVGGAG